MKVREKIALITGINGQDGSYLAEHLVSLGYQVHGTMRLSSMHNADKMVNLKNVSGKIKIHPCGLTDHLSVYKLISKIKPDECYHLAAASFVSYDFNDELSIISTNFNPTHYLLSAIKELVPSCKFYFSGSSEMFGNTDASPQNEETKFNPRSIYGIAKTSGFYVVRNYREHHGIYACTGITYNHESSRRDFSFVTRKISTGVAKIYLGSADHIELGNIDAVRDWGYAPEYVVAMQKMLNNPKGPTDYVISTGKTNSVKHFLDLAFSTVNLDYKKYLKTNDFFFRPSEKVILRGDSQKIGDDLGWKSEKKIEEIVEEMVFNDIALLKDREKR
ncbi:MAG: GDP-mannose 4,6-dehydratase [Holosporaceae bacterium]|jgi:GDPmannose 4,6-dehydratase|nr:GDP-mannose 4,6-dehydratase [Holosporaceae bacterium]